VVARSLPMPDLGPDIEPIAPVELASTCDPTVKPGTNAFAKFVLQHLGGRDSGITRDCGIGTKPNEHHEGRAWDWGVSAASPDDAARVEELLRWLFATDAYGNAISMGRRVGLMYVIWNERIWSSRYMDWRPYTGSNPHTDHVHFSLSWPGALGQTSFFSWLRGEHPELVKPKPSDWSNVVAFFAGSALGYGLGRWGSHRKG